MGRVEAPLDRNLWEERLQPLGEALEAFHACKDIDAVSLAELGKEFLAREQALSKDDGQSIATDRREVPVELLRHFIVRHPEVLQASFWPCAVRKALGQSLAERRSFS